MFTLCDSMNSHATLILYYHTSMLTYLLNITCTLVATCMILERLECTCCAINHSNIDIQSRIMTTLNPHILTYNLCHWAYHSNHGPIIATFKNKTPIWAWNRMVVPPSLRRLSITKPHKEDNPYWISSPIWLPMVEWYVVWCSFKNGYPENMFSFQEIGLRAQNMLTMLD